MIKSIRPKMIKILYSLFLAVFLFGVMGIFPKTVSALCSGDGCLGKDPATYGCGGDAVTKKSYPLGIGEVHLRYSGACNAKWARTLNTSAFWYYTGATVWWPPYTGIQYSYSASTNPGQTVYTSMVGHSKSGQACGKLASSPVAIPIAMNSSGYCTGFWETCILLGKIWR